MKLRGDTERGGSPGIGSAPHGHRQRKQRRGTSRSPASGCASQANATASEVACPAPPHPNGDGYVLAANVLADFKHVQTKVGQDFGVPRVELDKSCGHEVRGPDGLHFFCSGEGLKQAVQSGPDDVLQPRAHKRGRTKTRSGKRWLPPLARAAPGPIIERRVRWRITPTKEERAVRAGGRPAWGAAWPITLSLAGDRKQAPAAKLTCVCTSRLGCAENLSMIAS